MDADKVLDGIITGIFSPLYTLAVACAFAYFFYGGFLFIVNMNDPQKKNIGKDHLLWGTIGLFIILSVGAILKLFNEYFGGFFVY